ncbi:MAG: GSCFA domain-containing protein [Tannerellaceae bacterium]|jgi:hypothetical protein|nr:GSCFA domain-containing protein [Tannerellaceae bacterium]
MEWNTPVEIVEDKCPLSHRDTILLLGSCFAEEIGQKLSENKFAVDVNPFGILYNPASIARSVRRLLAPEAFGAADLFEHNGLYHSFAHHSCFSAPMEVEALEKMNGRLACASRRLPETSRLVITFGTACVYRLRSSGEVVSNCHKLPEKLFEREMLDIAGIASEWEALLLDLWELNPGLRALFTVSPVRHWKDGAHVNQLSKATLLLAIHELQSRYPERIAYFPAYEIVMDELRDYRFYAGDMLHPSPLAVEYVWERFCAGFLTTESQDILREWGVIRKAIAHRPFRPESKAYQDFIMQTLLKAELLSRKFPYFDLSGEIERLRSEIK